MDRYSRPRLMQINFNEAKLKQALDEFRQNKRHL